MWYIANIFFKAHCQSSPEPQTIWEERFVIFESETKANALEKALIYGKSQEHDYINNLGELLIWKFDSVGTLQQIEAKELCNELEIFSRFLKGPEVTSLKTAFDDK